MSRNELHASVEVAAIRLFVGGHRGERAHPVRRAVEAHGGSVEARRAEPTGLAVVFDLAVGS